ncbi:MAG: acyltransferase [Deltaproteobacteria bacterium]|jgi:1-acyl-sn-glycerol-3-phosphate acyltransferase|nr:acyltransferase [Deltaproteobacteria bacterium]MBW2535667.1 acyltransferase [Deltaproteobacteria bacterium]
MPLPPLPNPPRRADRVGGLMRAAPAVAFLSSTLLALNGAQTASLAVRPLSRRGFRRFNRWAADRWWGWCVTGAKVLHGTRIEVTGDDVPPRENAIVIANHQQMADITFLMFLARAKHRLGDLKWFVKKPIKYVPGVGWGMAFLDCIFVERNWARDRSSIERTFGRLIRDRVPLWLVTFPEGTRVTPEKIERSRAFAAERGLTPLRHVLVPRTKGFVATVQGLRSHADAVYDVTIGYEEGVPTLWQYVKGFATVAHFHVRRFPTDELPQSDGELGAWLHQRFERKDERLERFYQTGSFTD